MLHMVIAAAASPAASGITVEAVFAILASLVIVLGGLGALIRTIWKTGNIIRDLVMAVKSLTDRLDGVTLDVKQQFEKLSDRVYQIEMREFWRHPGEDQPGAPDHYPGRKEH